MSTKLKVTFDFELKDTTGVITLCEADVTSPSTASAIPDAAVLDMTKQAADKLARLIASACAKHNARLNAPTQSPTQATTQCTPLTPGPDTITVHVRSIKPWDDQDSTIATPQGPRMVKSGDYVITAMDGMKYVCQGHKFSPDFDITTGRAVVILDVGSHGSFPSGKMGGKF